MTGFPIADVMARLDGLEKAGEAEQHAMLAEAAAAMRQLVRHGRANPLWVEQALLNRALEAGFQPQVAKRLIHGAKARGR